MRDQVWEHSDFLCSVGASLSLSPFWDSRPQVSSKPSRLRLHTGRQEIERSSQTKEGTIPEAQLQARLKPVGMEHWFLSKRGEKSHFELCPQRDVSLEAWFTADGGGR